jgi:hypothetical protein
MNKKELIDFLKWYDPDSDHEKIAESYLGVESRSEKINKLQERFKDTLRQYVGQYPNAMLHEFFEYWSEPNKSMTKMRWQLEKTWDLSRRLKRWQRNGTVKQNNRKSFESESTEQAIQQTIMQLTQESY